MYPKHVGHENGGCGHLGGAPLSTRPTHTIHSPVSRAFLLARQLFLRCSLWAL